MNEDEILDMLDQESDRLWLQYVELKDHLEFDGAAKQVLAQHHQTCRIALRIIEGKWP
jgi:hypothetical protein